MASHDWNEDRRAFVARLTISVLAALIAAFSGVFKAAALTSQRLKPDDPTARALAYVDEAGKAEDSWGYRQGAHCGDCGHWRRQNGNPAWGACEVFSGRTVSRNGWCRAWSASE